MSAGQATGAVAAVPIEGQLVIEFNNPSPDTIEVRPVETTSLKGLEVPPDAISFQFMDSVPGRIPKAVSPTFFLSLDPVCVDTDAFPGRHTGHRGTEARKSASLIKGYGVVSYEMSDVRYSGKLLIPLTDATVLLERGTLKQVWPVPVPDGDLQPRM